jgi:hypothetical protein
MRVVLKAQGADTGLEDPRLSPHFSTPETLMTRFNGALVNSSAVWQRGPGQAGQAGPPAVDDAVRVTAG